VDFVPAQRGWLHDLEGRNFIREHFGRLEFIALIAMAIFLSTGFMATRANASEQSLILATTTSVRDSGLLDTFLPDFTRQTGIEVRVIAVGTGAALRMGREGNADVLLTHAPGAEQELVDEGIVTRRTPFMQNFFVIVGPAEDPADVAGATSPVDVLRRIAASQSNWVSRSDDSGTHKREKSLFESADIPANASWKGFDRTGSGMGLSLQVAGEHRAYILSDIGTFLAFEKRIDLVILSRPDESLRNVYSILQLDSTRFDRPIASDAANSLERFLMGTETQMLISHYGQKRFGRPLFTPLIEQTGPADPIDDATTRATTRVNETLRETTHGD
jgi:tungstate transport system substrate-binding protein